MSVHEQTIAAFDAEMDRAFLAAMDTEDPAVEARCLRRMWQLLRVAEMQLEG